MPFGMFNSSVPLTVWLPPDSQNCFCKRLSEKDAHPMRAAGNPYNTSCRDRLWGLGGGIGGRQVTASACACAVSIWNRQHGPHVSEGADAPKVGRFLMVPSTLFILKPFIVCDCLRNMVGVKRKGLLGARSRAADERLGGWRFSGCPRLGGGGVGTS